MFIEDGRGKTSVISLIRYTRMEEAGGRGGEGGKGHLFIDHLGVLDDLRRCPGESAPLWRNVGDIRVVLLLGQAEICHLADGTLVPIAQQQVGALQIEVDYLFLVEILHPLHPSPIIRIYQKTMVGSLSSSS
jgi:hypothetical protein